MTTRKLNLEMAPPAVVAALHVPVVLVPATFCCRIRASKTRSVQRKPCRLGPESDAPEQYVRIDKDSPARTLRTLPVEGVGLEFFQPSGAAHHPQASLPIEREG